MEDNHIADPRARAFVAELRGFEQSSDPTDLVGLFAVDATATRLDARGERSDMTAFWREYRGQFDRLSTTFFDAVEGTDQVALEWTSEATLTTGRPISYRDVTVLDLAGEKIAGLRTYYDSAAFVAIPAGSEA
jgi:ketosteroid isomerase-like protein